MIRATNITAIGENKERVCARCPAVLNKPRGGTMLCQSCYQVTNFEAQCARYGVDLAALADDEFVRIIDTTKDGQKAYKVIVYKESAAA